MAQVGLLVLPLYSCSGMVLGSCADFSGDTNQDGVLDAADCFAAGPAGPAGEQGSPGEQGAMGQRGYSGDPGPLGEQGSTGENGAQGTTGEQGPTGGSGENGAIGEQGPTGEAGEQGAVGEQGSTGQAGDQGATGAQGSAGEQGSTGPAGEQGSVGEQGPTGEAGEQGATGAQGSIQDPILELTTNVEAQAEAVMAVMCTRGTTSGGYGTGTKTADGDIITAFHVISGCTRLTYIHGNYRNPIVLGTSDAPFVDPQPIAGRDLAVLRSVSWTALGEALAGIEPIWDYSVGLGELTLTVGFPASFFNAQFTSGFVTAADLTETMDLFGRSIQWSGAFATDTATAGGASGGPVFDQQDRWIGIHVGASTDAALELSIQIPLRQ